MQLGIRHLEIAECDVLSGDDVNIEEGRFDSFRLDDVGIDDELYSLFFLR